MPCNVVLTHPELRCTAQSKHANRRCWNIAAYGCKTCYFHGARKPDNIRKGANCNFYKHGNETRAARLQRPVDNKKLKALAATIEPGKRTLNIDNLPEDATLKKLKRERDKILKKLNINKTPRPDDMTLKLEALKRKLMKP